MAAASSQNRLTAMTTLCLLLSFSAGNASADKAIQTTDDFARIIRLSAPAQRLVSLAPHLTELIHSAGAGDRLLAVSKHCDYPPRVQQLPEISDYQSINYEKIAMLKPDLILVWNAGLKSAQLKLLEKIVPQGVYVSKTLTLASIAANLNQIGKLTGMESTARQGADIFLEDLEQLRQRYQRKEPLPVSWLFWLEPPMAAGGTHWINEAIQICGGVNAYGDFKNQVVRLDREALTASKALVLYPFSGSSIDAVPFPRFKTVLGKDADLLQRPSLRMTEGIRSLCVTVSETSLTH